jgi:hypothetical protein
MEAATSAVPDTALTPIDRVDPVVPVEPILAKSPSVSPVVPTANPAPPVQSQRSAATPSDLSKAIAGLSKLSPEKRPAKATTLQHHLESHLRADLTGTGIADLLCSLYAQGWISEGPGGKLEYHLPRQ